MDPRMEAWADQEDARVASTIRKHGWAIEYIGSGACSAPGCDCGEEDDEPPFAYTIGLFGMGHPELLVFGLPSETTVALMNELGERIRNDEALMPGQLIEFDDWSHHVVPEDVPNPGEIVFGANRFYQRPAEYSVPVLQLTYNDLLGNFPWEETYLHPELQPRPGTFKA